MDVANNIYQIIRDKMLIQSAVAHKAGYTPNMFNAMLHGRKHILAKDIPRISNALGVTPNEIFGYADDNT